MQLQLLWSQEADRQWYQAWQTALSIATKIQPFSQGGRKAVSESLALCFPQYGC